MDQLDAQCNPPTEAALVGAANARQERTIKPMSNAA